MFSDGGDDAPARAIHPSLLRSDGGQKPMSPSHAFTEHTRRTLSGGAVTAVGVLLLAIPLYDMWDDSSRLGWSFAITFLENAAFLLLSGGVVLGGVWLVRSDWQSHHVSRVAKWTVGGVLTVSVLFLLVIAIQVQVLNRLKPLIIALDGIIIGSAVTFGLGVLSTKANVQRVELRKEQKARESLESLFEIVNALQQATTRAEVYEVGLDGVDALVSPATARVSIDGETVRRRRSSRQSPVEEVAATASIGDRGRIELLGSDTTTYEERALKLLGTHLDGALGRIEREQKLERERERLEFVNRFVRHNMLNGLNVVEARTDILGDYVRSEGRSHLELVRTRTADMIDLIETLSSVMTVVSESEDHELEPVDLERVLRSELRQAGEVFDTAAFEVSGGLSGAGTVLADDLLGEVFSEVLTNAVQHNDTDRPEVTVDVERGEETVTVRVADNGPGIPEELRDTVFEEGEKNFECPGTGFGLYLIREVVESYGGTVTVEENDPGGAVFSITLLRP